jgi:CubicO group peptidase (beta-lactamase class C family)
VARLGKVAQFEACGLMDIEDGKPMKRDTIFRIYSMSKPITSVAAMILYEEGKLKLDDPVSKYIPEFEGSRVVTDRNAEEVSTVPAEREMTVRDLMRHTSGLTYGIFGNTNVDKLYRKSVQLSGSPVELKDMAKNLAPIPLLYQRPTCSGALWRSLRARAWTRFSPSAFLSLWAWKTRLSTCRPRRWTVSPRTTALIRREA